MQIEISFMKKLLILFILPLLSVSCSQSFNDDDLQKLNGYWEIMEVEMPDGSKKEYTINSTIDYFELKGKQGVRKKVMPQLDGTYMTNELSEKITIIEEKGKTFIKYKTDHAEWKEELLEVDEENLIVRNEQEIEYHYKKPEPFTLK